MWRLEALRATANLDKKQYLPVITWNKKHSPKKVTSITYTLEEKFFAAAVFEGPFVSPFISERVKKL